MPLPRAFAALVFVPSLVAHAEEAPLPAPSRTCVVDGAWEVAFAGDATYEVAFNAGAFAGGSPAGRKAGEYEVTPDGLVFRGGSLGKAPRGEAACPAGAPGTYQVVYGPDCWTMKLQAVEDPCPSRRAILEGATWQR